MASPAKGTVEAKQPTEEELKLQHTVYYNSSTCAIKGDVAQLANCWKSGHGPLTKQEAGLLLWYHCYRGEDGQAEVVAANVVNICVAALDSKDAPTAEKSIAAGVLLTLCKADPKHKDAVVKGKAGPNSATQVLHTCLQENPEAVPRHIVALLACLAGSEQCLSAMLKVLAGGVPWSTYIQLLTAYPKDHAMAISVSDVIRLLVTGRGVLAAEAASSGLLPVLLSCAAKHKSAAAVGALAACLQALCEAAPDNCKKLGQLPGAIQVLVDLLGPPPESVVAWEKEEYKHILSPPPPPPPLQPIAQLTGAAAVAASTVAGGEQLQQQAGFGMRVSGSNCSNSMRMLIKAGGSNLRSSLTPRRTGTGALEADAGKKVGTSMKPAKSIRLPDVTESESSNGTVAASGHTQDPSLTSKFTRQQTCSSTGVEQGGGIAASRYARPKEPRRCSQGHAPAEPPAEALPQPSQPLLCRNSTAMKWDGPVPDATRSSVAGALAELVLLPELCQAVSRRLGASRLVVLLLAVMKQLTDGGKGSKAKKKKKSSKLVLTPETETLLTNVCVCMKFLVAADDANSFRVATAGCLPALVQLAAESKSTRLRQSAKAVLSQVCMLSEVQQQVKDAGVPEELLVQVPVKLTDGAVAQLQIEHPAAGLQRLDDVVARART